jgi:hypothetical protein
MAETTSSFSKSTVATNMPRVHRIMKGGAQTTTTPFLEGKSRESLLTVVGNRQDILDLGTHNFLNFGRQDFESSPDLIVARLV